MTPPQRLGRPDAKPIVNAAAGSVNREQGGSFRLSPGGWARLSFALRARRKKGAVSGD
jgi:hypothetical protein